LSIEVNYREKVVLFDGFSAGGDVEGNIRFWKIVEKLEESQKSRDMGNIFSDGRMKTTENG
jgi:hypothetical protein